MIGARIQQYHGRASALFRLGPRTAKDADEFRLPEAQDGFHEIFRFDRVRGDDRAGLSLPGSLSRPVDDGLNVVQRSGRWNGRRAPRAHLGQLRARDRAAKRFQLFRQCVIATRAGFADRIRIRRAGGRATDWRSIFVIASMASRSNSKPSIEMRSALKSSMVLAPPRAAMTFASAFCSSKNDLPRRTGVTSARLSTALSRAPPPARRPLQASARSARLRSRRFVPRRNSAAWQIDEIEACVAPGPPPSPANRRNRDSRNGASASSRRRDDPPERANSGARPTPHSPKPRKARRRGCRRPLDAAIQNSL